MNDDTEERTPLAEHELRALAGLRGPADPSARLYDRVVTGLRARGAIGQPRHRWAKAAAIAASIVIAFASGRLTALGPATAGGEFLFLLQNTPAAQWPASMTSGEIVAEFERWTEQLRRHGQVVVAAELADGRQLIDLAGAHQGNESLGVNGLFIVRAPTPDSAAALAATLPHVVRGGVVAVHRLR